MVNTSMLRMMVRKTYSLRKVTSMRPVRQFGQWALKFLLQTTCFKSSLPSHNEYWGWEGNEKICAYPNTWTGGRIFSRKGNCQHTGGKWKVVGEHRSSSNSAYLKPALTHHPHICAAEVPALLTGVWGSLSKLYLCLAEETKSGLLPPLLSSSHGQLGLFSFTGNWCWDCNSHQSSVLPVSQSFLKASSSPRSDGGG